MVALSKGKRLRAREVRYVLKKGKKIQRDGISVSFHKTEMPHSRFAVVVPTRVAKKNVDRNALRRKAKGVIQNHIASIMPGYDIVVVFRRFFTSSYKIEMILTSLLQNSPLYKGE